MLTNQPQIGKPTNTTQTDSTTNPTEIVNQILNFKDKIKPNQVTIVAGACNDRCNSLGGTLVRG